MEEKKAKKVLRQVSEEELKNVTGGFGCTCSEKLKNECAKGSNSMCCGECGFPIIIN